jgi:hypothetical protein
MKSPHFFIVKPFNDVLYDNEVELENGKSLITSSSFENHLVTNRQGVVQAVPTRYEGPILPGDKVVVHHNIFRKYIDMRGEEKFSSSLIRDNIYKVDQDEIFAFKSVGDFWVPTEGFCFVKPIDNTDEFSNSSEEDLHGEIVFLGHDLIKDGIKRGDKIIFTPISEYEFTIDGERLYRVKSKNVCLILS